MNAHEQKSYESDEYLGSKARERGKRLVIILHGFRGMTATVQMFEFLSGISPDTDVFKPRLPHDWMWCRKRLEKWGLSPVEGCYAAD